MIRKLGRFTVLINNYDEALAFYVDKLGFEVITDQPAHPHRFVHICYKEQFPVGIWLWKADQETQHLVGNQAGSHPLIVLYTTDCISDYFALRDNGVEFISEPTETETEIHMHALDLYGNVIVFVEMLDSK